VNWNKSIKPFRAEKNGGLKQARPAHRLVCRAVPPPRTCFEFAGQAPQHEAIHDRFQDSACMMIRAPYTRGCLGPQLLSWGFCVGLCIASLLAGDLSLTHLGYQHAGTSILPSLSSPNPQAFVSAGRKVGMACMLDYFSAVDSLWVDLQLTQEPTFDEFKSPSLPGVGNTVKHLFY
jgi:hypothetical protein